MPQVTALDLTGIMGPIQSFSAKEEAVSNVAVWPDEENRSGRTWTSEISVEAWVPGKARRTWGVKDDKLNNL